MSDFLLQKVEACNTKEGQQVKLIYQRAWWTVLKKENDEVVLQRGKQTKRVDLSTTLLQNLFENL